MQSLDLSNVKRATREARGLPNPCYVSDEYFVVERDRVFAKTWTCVGVASDVPSKGDYRPVELAGLPLLLVRGQDDRLRVFANVCSHRGVQLVGKPGNGSLILCPYHAWTYDLSGRAVRTPHFGGPGIHQAEGVELAELGLREIRVEMWLDFVFIDLSGTAEPLLDWLAPLIELWSHYDLAKLRHGGCADFTVKANWKLATENTMEFYHLPSVHRGLNSYSPADEHYHCNAGNRFMGTATRDYNPQIGSGSLLPRFQGLTPAATLVGEYPVVFPNLWLGVHVDHFYAVVIYPLAPDLTLERFHVYFVGDEALAPAYDEARAEILERWSSVNREDIGITELMQRGRHSPTFDGGRMSPVQDVAIHHFMKMIVDRLEA
jgi:choline monooxygenase